MSPPYAQHWPSYGDPRIIHLKCRKCAHQWVELIPERNAKAFCYAIACDCGADQEHDNAILVTGGSEGLKQIIHGSLGL